MTEAPESPDPVDKAAIERGLQEGSAEAEAKVRSADYSQSELGLGPDTMDQEASVEAQRDELEQDDPGA
jgi:hypothetical protein